MFEKYYEKFMGMKKAEIIREGVACGVWADSQSTSSTLMKWKKMLLARQLADRLTRQELRGY